MNKIDFEFFKSVFEASGLSRRAFCRESGLNRGSFHRIMKREVEISKYNGELIYKFAEKKGFIRNNKNLKKNKTSLLMYFIYAILTILMVVFFGYACLYAIDKEARRQCIQADSYCANYSDLGACEKRFVSVCDKELAFAE